MRLIRQLELAHLLSEFWGAITTFPELSGHYISKQMQWR